MYLYELRCVGTAFFDTALRSFLVIYRDHGPDTPASRRRARKSCCTIDPRGNRIRPRLGSPWFPHLDPALLAGWAEEVGQSMQSRADFIRSPKRYAFAALHGKVREWYRSGASKEIPVGIGTTLEHWVAVDRSMQVVMDRAILFEQLKSKLNDRDRQILALLQQDKTSPASVAAALGVSYAAAAKAIQRVKDRLAAILVSAPIDDQEQTSPLLYGTKD